MKRLLPPRWNVMLLPVGSSALRRAVALCLIVLSSVVGVVAQQSDLTNLTVADAWALAEANHPRVVEARQRLTSLQRDVSQREAAYAPNVTLTGTGLTLHVDPSGTVLDPNPGATVSAALKLTSGLSFSASMSTTRKRLEQGQPLGGSLLLSYPLLRSAALDSDALALRQAETALTAAHREFEQLRDEVRAEVLGALHAQQVAALRAELARDGYAEARVAWEAAQRRVDAGIATETELIGAQIELLRAEQEEIVASRTWHVRQQQLAYLLGLDGDVSAYQFESVLQWNALPGAGELDEAVLRAVEQSVTVWERIQAEETARLQLAEERERSGFEARLEGGYTPQADNSSTNAGWRVGLQVSYPLADGGQRRMTLASREEAYARARENREAAERDVREQVQELYYELEDALRAVEIAELELARTQLELAAIRRQAELPVATAAEQAVQQSARAVSRAELNVSEAVQRYQARWLALQRLQGEVRWHELMEPDSSAVDNSNSAIVVGEE